MRGSMWDFPTWLPVVPGGSCPTTISVPEELCITSYLRVERIPEPKADSIAMIPVFYCDDRMQPNSHVGKRKGNESWLRI